MKAVGIKNLKARLSEYVRLAKAGETILVTERDEVVAELRPARRQRPTPEGLAETLESLAEAGEITRAAVPKGGWRWKPEAVALPAGTAKRILDEIRDERDGV
ncbi:MAG TPA: type II toxin-antitoxin system Phd/YefM family antitoxin [Thermoanaerobaculia bacterium]|jgi:antitoxin (DNA-binding transcriptional repressor) of toxin-antitoxin stability system|nr:type II toxin-antitoxin system Phd/YefM family antitoxin [Thermoanaerobaculia bacterium]